MDRRIKILYIIDTLDSTQGGTENQLIKLINGLNKKEFQVHLICFKSNPWLEESVSTLECDFKLIKINGLYKPGTYLNFITLVRYLRRIKPDIVHTFFPVGNIVGVLAANFAGIRAIFSSRRDYGEWMVGPYLFTTRIANRFVRTILANSRPVKELTERKEKVDRDKVEVILNGIDTKIFRNLKRDLVLKRELGIPEHHKVIGIVANFRPMKHHYTFVKAAKEILKTREDIHFLFIGGGPLKNETEQLGRSLEVFSRLIFAGPQNEIIPFLSILDVGVNCSEGEGLSNAIIEYMASGVPCVVADAGGNPDLIIDGVTGCLFPLDDYKTLASLTLKLLDDRATRDRLVKNAFMKIENEMGIDVIISKYQAFYQKKLNV